MDSSENFAACDLKFGICIHIIELMKVCEYSRLWPFLDHHLYMKIKLAFLKYHWPVLIKL